MRGGPQNGSLSEFVDWWSDKLRQPMGDPDPTRILLGVRIHGCRRLLLFRCPQRIDTGRSLAHLGRRARTARRVVAAPRVVARGTPYRFYYHWRPHAAASLIFIPWSRDRDRPLTLTFDKRHAPCCRRHGAWNTCIPWDLSFKTLSKRMWPLIMSTIFPFI